MKPTQERLKELFTYVDGNLIRNISRGNAKKGSVAGSKDSHGHIQVSVDGRTYLAHILIWVYHYGTWPKELDHKDTVRDNNRIDNLREVTRQQNLQNKNSQKGSSSKYKGVSWKKSNNKWVAQYMDNGKYKHIGLFETEIEAAMAYDKAVANLHKEYARKNVG